MSITNLRSQLAKIRRSLPAVTASDGATRRFADLLSRIEAEPAGPRRRWSIYVAVTTSRHEEPEDFAALLAALGPARIAEAFPDGDVPGVCPDACVRAQARAYVVPAGSVDPITEMLQAAIKKRDQANAMEAGE